ncbi:NAD-dependent epimerase/dehydratase family protein (plasmid) [Embleya sp. NBC_00888]|uniref:NAD-dependent epimerase/dehydratase family protein n=1 Tax=Embleya sp. NBC_00888 TaxID=2975960 RepID=UPI002F912136|nr:NAD-dependent epimerase/dehydratase family protein [Embleya sp. NBC_00888]
MSRAGRVVLVTGAAGFVGGHVAAVLARAGWMVVGCDVRRAPASTAAQRWVRGDGADPARIAEIAAGAFEAVVLQGAITDTRVPDSAALRETNTLGPLRIAAACARSGTRLVYASSHSVYGRLSRRAPIAEGAVADRARCSGPLNAYAVSKLALDTAMCRSYPGRGAGWVGLRYTNVFGSGEMAKGPMASILSQLVRGAAVSGRVRVFADTLTAARDYVPVETVADTVARLLEEAVPAGVYNLGAGHAVSFAQLLEWCAGWHGADLVVDLVPNPVAGAYQYYTCADMTALDAVLPGVAVAAPPDVVREAAAALFSAFVEQGTAQGRWGSNAGR